MIYFIIAAVVILADLLSKVIVAGSIEFGREIPVVSGVLNITNVSNDGIAFGMMDNARWLFMLVTFVMMVFIAFFIIKVKGYTKLLYVIAAVIFGGGMGNLVDRIICLGKYDLDKAVVDFIDFCAFPDIWRYTFNVADIAVCVGAGLFILYLLAFDKKAYKNGFKAVLYEEKKPEKDVADE